MKVHFYFILLLLLPISLANEQSQVNAINPDTILNIIAVILKGLKEIKLNNISITLPTSDLIEGSLNTNGGKIYFGDKKDIVLKATKKSDSVETISCKFYWNEIGLSIENYDLDFGIIKQIPLYGDGSLKIGFRVVDIQFSLDLDNTKGLSVENFVFQELSFNADQSNLISGFLRNPQISELLTNLINMLGEIGVILYKIEEKCIKCILQELIQFLANLLLQNKPAFKLDCACLNVNKIYEMQEQFENIIQNFNYNLKQ